MKLVKNTTFKKSLLKATSGILSFILTANIGLFLMHEIVSAGGEVVKDDSITYSLKSNGTDGKEYFYLVKDGDEYFIQYLSDYEEIKYELISSQNCNFVLYGKCTLEVKTDYQFGSLHLDGGDTIDTEAALIVDENVNVTLNSVNIYGSGINEIVNQGKITCDGFSASLLKLNGLKEFQNYGVLSGSTIYIDSNIYSDTSVSSIEAQNRFYILERSINALVDVTSLTNIESDNGNFTLRVNGEAIKEISGVVDAKADTLVNTSDVTLGTVPNILVGETHNFNTYIQTASGYPGTPYLEFSTDNGVTWSTTEPNYDSTGSYHVRAVAPASGSYMSSTSSAQLYNVSYLDISDQKYYTFGNVVNGNYVSGEVKVVPISGYQISFNGEPYADYAMVSVDDVIDPYGNYRSDVYFRLKNINSGAVTAQTSPYYNVGADFKDLIVDSSDPVFFAEVYYSDGTDAEISLNRKAIYGTALGIAVRDENLDTVTLTVDGTETNKPVADNMCTIDLYNFAGKAQHIKITATDLAGRKSEAEFYFYPELIESTLSLSVPEIIYAGEDYEIGITTNNTKSNVSIEYYLVGDEEPLDGKPTTIGDYVAYVTIEANDIYTDTADSIEFSIIKKTPESLLNVPEVIYTGDDYNIEFNTDSDGEVTYQYYDKNNDSYLDTKPTSAGEYIVTGTTAETAKYYRSEKTATIKIIKRTADTTAIAPEVVYVGNDYDVEADTDSDGNITYQYYDKDNGSYLSSKPTSAGEYTVTVSTPETSKYYSSEDSASFKIIKRDPTVSLSVPDTTVGQTYSPEFVTNSDSTSITYEYKVKGASDSTYSKTKPTAAGSYTIRVTVGSTEKFNEASATDSFTISKKAASVSLGIGTPYAGTTYTPSFSSNSDAASRAVFEYKEKNADDSKYSKTSPNTVGTYVVRVTIPETENYAETIVTADFRIIYLDAPQTAYLIEGQSGKNNFYVSDVVIKAPTGFTISAAYGGTYTASIPYKDGITSVYLKRTSDNALTNAIPIANAPRVDKSAPSISTPNGTIAPGSVIYTSDFTLNVSDPNLRSLKVNGEPIDLANYKNGYTLTLNPGYGSQTYKLMAEDEAGNVTTLEFTLKAEWLKDKVIIPDVVLPLEGNESYNLGDGYWLVTRNTPSGPVTDKTVYSGNTPFYVNEGGDYTFTKITQ